MLQRQCKKSATDASAKSGEVAIMVALVLVPFSLVGGFLVHDSVGVGQGQIKTCSLI